MIIYNIDPNDIQPAPKWFGCVVAIAVTTLVVIGIIAVSFAAYMVYKSVMYI